MSPKTKEQFAAIRSRSEERIMDAALELFATKGFTSTSISSIASKANISKGLIYNYFESKNDLLRRIVIRAQDIGKDLFNEVIEDYESPYDELKYLVLNVIEHFKTHTEYWRLLTALSFQQEVMTEIADIIEQNSQWSIEKGAEIFQEMGAEDPMKEALFFGATLDGMMMHYLHLKDHYPIDMMADKLIQSIHHIPDLKES